MMALFGAGSFVGGYVGGRLTDRFGFFYVQVFSLLCNGLLFILLGYLKTLWAIGVCIFALSSLGEAFRPANSAAIAAYSDEHNRTRCYSLNRLAINLGWAVGPAVGGLLASIDYKLLFWTDGLTCLAASVLLYRFLSVYHARHAAKQETDQPPTFSKAHTDRFYLKSLFFLLLIGIVFFQLFSMVPVYYKTEVHLSEATIGTVLALNGIIIAVVEMVLVYRLQNKRSDFQYIVFGSFLTGTSFLLLALAPSLVVVVAAMLAVTFGEMFLFPYTNNIWINRSTAGNRGQYAAFYAMTFAVAQVLAPTGAAKLVQAAGFPVLFAVDFFICAIAALGFYFLYKQTLQHGIV
jgi:predicted MFS family arabinose efflux permease